MVLMLEPACAGAHNAAPRELLRGCWTQTLPESDTFPDKEWGSRTWCFGAHGKVKSVNFACSKRGGCDGWCGEWTYRWRGRDLELRDWQYDQTGKGKKVWRRCRPSFAGGVMMLGDCYFSPREWVRQ